MHQQIRSELIQPGFCLPGALCDASGRVLFPRGTRLTDAHITQLGVRVVTGLYGGDDWPEEIGQACVQDKAAGPCSTPPEAGSASKPAGASEACEEVHGTVIGVQSLRLGMRLSRDV